MNFKQKTFLFTVILGIVSFGSLVLCYLAGKEIWHGSGDVYTCQWQVLRWGTWPIVLFHTVFFITATITMMKWKK